MKEEEWRKELYWKTLNERHCFLFNFFFFLSFFFSVTTRWLRESRLATESEDSDPWSFHFIIAPYIHPIHADNTTQSLTGSCFWVHVLSHPIHTTASTQNRHKSQYCNPILNQDTVSIQIFLPLPQHANFFYIRSQLIRLLEFDTFFFILFFSALGQFGKKKNL